MRLEYISSFVNSTYEILSKYVSNISVGEIILKEKVCQINGIAIIIGLTNDVQGSVIVNVDSETAGKVAKLMGEEIFDDTIVYAAIGELSNIIVGRAVTNLENEGFDVGVTPPVIIKGNQFEYTSFHTEVLYVEINTIIGGFNLFLTLTIDKD